MERHEKVQPCDVSAEFELSEMRRPHPGNAAALNRRDFFRRAITTAAGVSALDFLSYFNAYGSPLPDKATRMAHDKAAEGDTPHYLIYWYVEGGWESYDMFSPLDTAKRVVHRLPPDQVTKERYRVLKAGQPGYTISKTGNIRHGYLADPGRELFPEM